MVKPLYAYVITQMYVIRPCRSSQMFFQEEVNVFQERTILTALVCKSIHSLRTKYKIASSSALMDSLRSLTESHINHKGLCKVHRQITAAVNKVIL